MCTKLNDLSDLEKLSLMEFVLNRIKVLFFNCSMDLAPDGNFEALYTRLIDFCEDLETEYY